MSLLPAIGGSKYAMYFKGNPTPFLGAIPNAQMAQCAVGISPPSGEIWITTVMAHDVLPSAIFAQSCWYHGLTATGHYLGDSPINLEAIGRTSAGQWDSTSFGFQTVDAQPSLVTEKWYILESMYHAGVGSESTITCIGHWSKGPTRVHSATADTFHVGTFYELDAGGEAVAYVASGYVAYAAVGTSRRGTDIFVDDFSSHSLSAWGFHTPWTGIFAADGPLDGYGCTIVPRPNYKFYNYDCKGAGFRSAPLRVPTGNVGDPNGLTT